MGGSALLPTALMLDLLAGATRRVSGAAAGLRLSGIQVDDPVRFLDGSPQDLVVLGRQRSQGQGWDVELRGSDGPVHLRATIAGADPGSPRSAPVATTRILTADLPGTPELVYPPMFHGPAFQVLGRFGCLDGAVVAEPAADQVPWHLGSSGGALPGHLLELMFQACGVWELAWSGRMMRPRSIGELVVPAPRGDLVEVGVRVRAAPASGQENTEPAADRTFDAEVFDPEGRILASVRSYRPVELGVPALDDVARRITERIGRLAPPHSSTTPQGAQR